MMSRLKWDETGKKKYEYGVSKGVLYLYDEESGKWIGEAWNGLTSVSDSPDGGEAQEMYSDNILYASIRSVERNSGTIEAYTTPRGWAECLGQKRVVPGMLIRGQARRPFALAYRVEIGNDMNSEASYRLHVFYNCTAKANEVNRQTTTDSVDVEPLSFDFDSNPVPVEGYKPTSHIVFNAMAFRDDPAKLKALESVIYGNESRDASLPPPSFFLAMSYEDLGIMVLDKSTLDANIIV